MKRCPTCNFPNIDTDKICFKCHSALLEESPVDNTETNLNPKPTTNPNTNLEMSFTKIKLNSDELTIKSNPLFDSNTNISNFIHTPTESTQSNTNPTTTISTTSETASKETAATSIPLPTTPVPPLTTSLPSQSTPARIVPRYKALSRLKTISPLLGILFGIALATIGALLVPVYPGILGIVSCIGFVALGVISIFLSFVLSAVLEWMNDVECNQRKQTELINHIYHKMED